MNEQEHESLFRDITDFINNRPAQDDFEQRRQEFVEEFKDRRKHNFLVGFLARYRNVVRRTETPSEQAPKLDAAFTRFKDDSIDKIKVRGVNYPFASEIANYSFGDLAVKAQERIEVLEEYIDSVTTPSATRGAKLEHDRLKIIRDAAIIIRGL